MAPVWAVIDDYSRFPLLETLTTTTAATIIKRLDNIFSIFSVPNYVRTDNGPAFRSKELEDFAKHMGFKHHIWVLNSHSIMAASEWISGIIYKEFR